MTSTTPLLHTPIHNWHAAHGGRMVDFAGWSMPVQYRSIVDEHTATRTACGVFDISHMGRLTVRGAGAAAYLDGLVTRRVDNMKPGQIRYGLMCREDGGVLDDVLVYAVADLGVSGGTEPAFAVVCNAGNRAKIVAWMTQRLPAGVSLEDETMSTAMIALQGPRALALVNPKCSIELMALGYYRGGAAKVMDAPAFVSRTGYTGEDGVEIVCGADAAPAIWEKLVEAAEGVGGGAVGLGARDTLRLEAGMPLYGHELTEAIRPDDAGLGFAINLKDRTFVGSAVLAADDGISRPVRVGLELEGRRAAREGCPVMRGDDAVGVVTSGSFSPTFQRPLAMATVDGPASAVGTELTVDVRGTALAARVVALPFYKRPG